ncbi:MAG: glycosyltransferase family 2 protein [Chloroflexaceae bacterium]|nr:glycosyltransferase family 2 protein [Chloroflexaceae bacterium]
MQRALALGSQYILLLNDDTIVPPDLLTRLVLVQQQHPEIGIITPKLQREDTGRLAGLGCFVKPCSIESVGWDTPDIPQQDGLLLFDAIFGTAMFIEHTVFEAVGLFDERFFFYYEDIDFCLRAREQGYLSACDPAVTVQHAVAASSQRVPGLRQFYMGRGRQIFFRKYCRGWRRPGFLLREVGRVGREVRYQLQQQAPARALAYVGGVLVGLVVPLSLRQP